MGYTPDMDTHTEYTVTQTSVRQSLIHFTQVGQALPAHPLVPVCYRFQVQNVQTFSQNALSDDSFWDTQNHTKRDRCFGNVSKSAASHSPEPLKAGGDFYYHSWSVNTFTDQL